VRKLSVLDLYCGVGGFSEGFKQAGFKIKYAIEYKKNIAENYKLNHPKTKVINADIRDLNPNDFKDVDIIIASPPCQSFSQANNVKDIENSYHLPKYIKKSKFPKIEVFNSKNYGAVQSRRRCFAGKYIEPQKTHIPLFLPYNSSKSVIKRNNSQRKKVSAKYLIGSYSSKELIEGKRTPFLKRHPPIKLNKPSRTITSKEDNHTILTKNGLFYLLPEECKLLQNFLI